MGTTRRQFLAIAAGVGAAAAVPRVARAADPVFPQGIASGDPLADRVIIWTRVVTTKSVSWQVATDSAFAAVVRSGTVTPSPAADHTIKVDVDGLSPYTTYWYRFSVDGATSPVGRTRTLPAPGAAVERVRVGVVTCAEWEFGQFGGYRMVAERDDLDFVLSLGDYIYEFGNDYGDSLPSPKRDGRIHQPPREVHTLAEYRSRYQQYKSDPALQKLHAAHAVIAIYDDHEVANDWYTTGAEQHSADEGDWITRRNAALQAFREYLPIRVHPVDPLQVYRRFQVGNLIDLFMLDERLYRDNPPMNAVVGYLSVDPATDDPNRTMLGAAQKAWLFDGLKRSTASWKVLGNPVSMMPIDVGPALAGALSAALSPLGSLPPIPPPLMIDGWDGYNAERAALLNFIHDNNVKDVVVLTGDYHESFATQLPYDRSTYDLNQNSAAVEFIAPAITSPGLSETLQMGNLPNALTINTVFEANNALSNHWVKYHDGFRNGFGIAEFRQDGMQYDFWFVADRYNAATGGEVGKSMTVPRGSSVLAAAAGPLGPRPPAPASPATNPQVVGTIPATGHNQNVALVAGAAAVGLAAATRLAKKTEISSE